MRQLYVAGNWKLHKTISESVALARELSAQMSSSSNKLMIAPPFTALDAVNKVLASSDILLGAQNMASVEAGAHTGEVSVLMLKDAGVQTVILGHSERRIVYGEPDELINAKVKLALKHDLELILCVGETLDQREAGKAEEVVGAQVRAGLKDLSESQLQTVTIAYEPVWAIGTGKNATPDDADSMHCFIRNTLVAMYSKDAGEQMTIQYGGSVKPENAESLLKMENIDGALVGGASLTAESFVPIGILEL